MEQESKWQTSFIQHGLSLWNAGQSAAKCTESGGKNREKCPHEFNDKFNSVVRKFFCYLTELK